MRYLLTSMFLVFCSKGSCQLDGNGSGIISMSALGYQRVDQDVFSSLNIIASAAGIKKKAVGICAENRFMMKGVSRMLGVLTLPLKRSGLGLESLYQGMNSMNFMGMSAGLGMDLGDNTSMGLKLEGGRSVFPSGNKIMMAGFQSGIILRASKKTHMGIHLTKRSFIRSNKRENENGTYIIHAGIGHMMNEVLYLSCELIKQKNTQAFLSPYLKWQINENLYVQTGIIQLSGIAYIGVGWKLKDKTITLSFATHSHLGMSGSLSMTHVLSE